MIDENKGLEQVIGSMDNNQAIGIHAGLSIPDVAVSSSSWIGKTLVSISSEEDTASIQAELEAIGLTRMVKPKKESNGWKGFFARVMDNIRSFFRGW